MGTQTITIDADLCIGCGLCVATCAESAIALVDGKAALVNAAHCDGLGRCLPACPVDAISFSGDVAAKSPAAAHAWPLQIQLVLPNAWFLDGANLLIAADCSAFAYANFHSEFMQERVALIACPKLDSFDYVSKLTEIFQINEIRSITTLRMDVPCCFGLESMVREALLASGKSIPLTVVEITTDGKKGSIS